MGSKFPSIVSFQSSCAGGGSQSAGLILPAPRARLALAFAMLARGLGWRSEVHNDSFFGLCAPIQWPLPAQSGSSKSGFRQVCRQPQRSPSFAPLHWLCVLKRTSKSCNFPAVPGKFSWHILIEIMPIWHIIMPRM